MSRGSGAVWLAPFVAKWRARVAEHRALGDHRCAEVALPLLEDLERYWEDFENQLLTPAEAHEWSGRNPDSLSRDVREGRLNNYGAKHRPLYRRSELPAKPIGQPTTKPWRSDSRSTKIASTRTQIARAVAHRHGGDE